MKKAISEFFKMVLIFLAGKFKKFTMRFKKSKTMKDYMMVYYSEAKSARLTGKKVAWITSGGPVEPLIAMDVIPIYPENHGAMIGASKMGGWSLRKGGGHGLFSRFMLLRALRYLLRDCQRRADRRTAQTRHACLL